MAKQYRDPPWYVRSQYKKSTMTAKQYIITMASAIYTFGHRLTALAVRRNSEAM